MEILLKPYFTYTNLLVEILILWGVYWLLTVLHKRMRKGVIFGKYQQRVTDLLSTFLLLYEPLTILLITIVFIFINPVMHGIILLLLTIAGFNRIRDYLSGRIILATSLVVEGKRLKSPKASGVISRIGRIGVYLQTGDSLSFVNYTNLLTEGYSLGTGQKIGGYYQLNINPPETANPLRELAQKFVSAPYLDRSFKPELSFDENSKSLIRARIAVREEEHLRELMELMGEWGFPATIARK
jgi:hypothetical protein